MSGPDVFTLKTLHISHCHCERPLLHRKLYLKSLKIGAKDAESQTHSFVSYRIPHSLVLKTKLGLRAKGHDITVCFCFVLFSQERLSIFSYDFISSRGISKIRHHIKFLACLFNLRNCKNDDRWHTELTYVLYSSLKMGVHRNFAKSEATVGRSILKSSRGSLDSYYQNVWALLFLKALIN